jgi:ribosomal protein L21E
MRRRVAALAMAAVLGAALGTSATPRAQAQSGISVYVDGQPANFDVPPTVIQGRVLVPLRGVFERLGATVDYDSRTQHIVAIRGPQTVELTIGSRQARVNGVPQLLDVPAFTLAGRTMVPLRFVSESLGASVQWVEASRLILIGSTGAAPPPPASGYPSALPPGQPQTITGRLMAVTGDPNPSIVVRTAGGQDQTIAVTPSTVIFRYNQDSNAGGSASLASLQRGDRVAVEVNGAMEARKITATYHIGAAGRIASVSRGQRTVTLVNGQTFTVLPDARITLNGQLSDWTALQNGRNARFLVVQGGSEAYEVHVVDAGAQPGATPIALPAPTISAPGDGAAVSPNFTVEGAAQPGALVVVRAQPRLFGNASETQTTADARGRWRVNMNLTTIPVVGSPYVISAVEIMNGSESDASSISVNVR